MDLDPEKPPLLNSLEERAFEKYFNVETESMAAEGYATSKEERLRKVALRVIVQYSKCVHFDAFIPYLAMNYFDRFISRHQLPNVLGSVREDILLAAICCLTLAWKMRNETFRFSYLSRDMRLKEEYKHHILNMELQILNGLRWRMRPINAICFLSFFVGKIPVGKFIKRRTLNEIAIQAQGDIFFTQLKPSVIAASALLIACKFLFPNEYERCKGDLLAYVKEEEIEPCFKKIYEMCIETQINMERNEKFKEGTRLKLEAGETSSSMLLNKDIPTKVIPEIEEEAEREPEPSSGPTHDISEIQEEPESETGPNTISQRHGKEQMQEKAESKTKPSSFTRRPGKEPLLEMSEIQELPDESNNSSGWNFELNWELMNTLKTADPSSFSSNPGEPMLELPWFRKQSAEKENDPGLNFGLKWKLSSGNPEEFTIDSPLFRPPAPIPDRNDVTNRAEARDDSTLFVQCMGCILM